MKLVIFDLDDTLYDCTGQLNGSLKGLEAIKPFPETLDALRAITCRKALVTKGMLRVQYGKIRILDIASFFPDIFVCKDALRKKKAFKKILGRYSYFNASEIVVFGNRRDEEIRFGNELGLVTILLRHGKYKDMEPVSEFDIPKFEIDSITELPDLLR
ncbi:MAG TPA: hypothetical protein VJH55_01450 [Candidatus Paceibacterota bacterium]